MKKGPVALLGAAFLGVALSGCSKNDEIENQIFYSCGEGLHSAIVTTDSVVIDEQAHPVVSASLFLYRPDFVSSTSAKPFYIEKKSYPLPAQVETLQKAAYDYCTEDIVPATLIKKGLSAEDLK